MCVYTILNVFTPLRLKNFCPHIIRKLIFSNQELRSVPRSRTKCYGSRVWSRVTAPQLIHFRRQSILPHYPDLRGGCVRKNWSPPFFFITNFTSMHNLCQSVSQMMTFMKKNDQNIVNILIYTFEDSIN